MAVTKQQVKIYMSQRKQGKRQAAAAAQAGISESTGRRIERGTAGKDRLSQCKVLLASMAAGLVCAAVESNRSTGLGRVWSCVAMVDARILVVAPMWHRDSVMHG